MAGYEAQTLPLCFDAFLPALISVPVDGSELHYGGKSGSVNYWHISRVVKQKAANPEVKGFDSIANVKNLLYELQQDSRLNILCWGTLKN